MGGARTALFNWLWARHNGGKFILRIEDTDAERSTEESTQQIIDSMAWLGLDIDEGPFYQSRRMDLYKRELQRLVDMGVAYRAFETPAELEAMREKAMAEGRNPIYDRKSLSLSEAEIAQKLREGVPFVWRFKCPPGKTEVPETLRGGAADCTFDNETLGDFALTRAGTEDNWGGPLYNFCCAVDDADMAITHVIRANEHLSNTPRQILIYEALGYKVPTYTHLPLVMKNNKKMSKRDGDADPKFPVSVLARRDRGYLPEAMLNFIALLGWSLDDKTEFFSKEDLIRHFTLDGLSKANANFDEDKFLFVNGYYIRNMPAADIVPRVKSVLAAAGMNADGRDNAWLESIIALEIERCKLLTDFPEALEYFFKAPTAYEEKGAKKLFAPAEVALGHLGALGEWLADVEPFEHAGLEAGMRALAESRGVGFGALAQPLRLALTGRTATPGMFDVVVALGREECRARVAAACEWIKTPR